MKKLRRRSGRPGDERGGLNGYLPPMLVSVLAVLMLPSQAAAYIDPISGSIIFQILMAAALGALLTVKRVWAAVTGACSRIWDGVVRLWRR